MCKLGRVEKFLFALTHILVQLHKKAFLLKEFRFLKHFKKLCKASGFVVSIIWDIVSILNDVIMKSLCL